MSSCKSIFPLGDRTRLTFGNSVRSLCACSDMVSIITYMHDTTILTQCQYKNTKIIIRCFLLKAVWECRERNRSTKWHPGTDPSSASPNSLRRRRGRTLDDRLEHGETTSSPVFLKNFEPTPTAQVFSRFFSSSSAYDRGKADRNSVEKGSETWKSSGRQQADEGMPEVERRPAGRAVSLETRPGVV